MARRGIALLSPRTLRWRSTGSATKRMGWKAGDEPNQTVTLPVIAFPSDFGRRRWLEIACATSGPTEPDS
jgi:hypothetical protein